MVAKKKPTKKKKITVKRKTVSKEIDTTENACLHLATNILKWKWNKKKNLWITPNKQEIELFTPNINRIHAEWLLNACPRYSIEKLNVSEIFVRVEDTSGKWACVCAPNECVAICNALLSLTGYKE